MLASTDVLVVGSGPAGLAAALASARAGAKTMIVEHYGSFGGNITQAMVGTIGWYRHEHTVEAGGIGVEFERRASAAGASHEDYDGDARILDSEMFKIVADDLIAEAGVIPILQCTTVGALMEGATITGIITESKSGRCAILAQRVVDATGDGDVAALAGAEHLELPPDERMGVTVTFSCSGVDKDEFLAYVYANPQTLGDWARDTSGKEDALFSTLLREPFARAKAAGDIPKTSSWEGSGAASPTRAMRPISLLPTSAGSTQRTYWTARVRNSSADRRCAWRFAPSRSTPPDSRRRDCRR